MNELLRVEDLHARFNTATGVVRAVDGVSFEVSRGDTLGIVGESGSGKSVTALSLMRLLPTPPAEITQGRVLLDGVDLLRVSDAEIQRVRGKRIAMIFQDPMTSLNPVLTIARQVTEALQLHLGLDGAVSRERAIELLDLVGIPAARTRVDDYPHQFSGGMRQRVMIAMALSCDPELILADEPTTALDVTIQAQILELLKSLSVRFHTATVLITHDLGVVAGMTQRVHVMYAGQIVEKATTRELFAHPRMPYTWGLLRSIPRLDRPRRSRLYPIDGTPPSLTSTPAGCRFAARCQYKRDRCESEVPALLQVAGGDKGHEARCFATQPGGWLVGRPFAEDESSDTGAMADAV